MDLSDLKKEYAVLEKKHGLPKFKQLNDDFEIEKIDNDTETLLRVVRKVMMEKIVNSISFLEMLLNPMNAPRMYLPFIKSMGIEDTKEVDRIYKILADLSLLSLSLEFGYDEKKEAEIIKSTFKEWNVLKKDFQKLVERLNKPNDNHVKKERNYFG